MESSDSHVIADEAGANVGHPAVGHPTWLRLDGLAEGEADEVGGAGEVAGSGAVAGGGKRDGRKRLEADVESAQEGCAGRGEQLLLDAGRKDGRALEKLDGGGCGNGQDAVSTLYRAGADVEGGAVPAIGGEGFDGDGRADDVDDGVLGADLVEVDGLGRAIVNLGLSLGEEFEGFEREGLRGRADGSAGDDLADLGQSAMVVGSSVRGVSVSVGMGVFGLVRVFVLVGVRVLMENFAGQVDVAVDEDIDFGRS